MICKVYLFLGYEKDTLEFFEQEKENKKRPE